MCENDQKPDLEPEPEPEPWKKSSGAGATLMKTKSSGARARDMFLKRIISVSFLRRLRSPDIIHTVAGHIDDPE